MKRALQKQPVNRCSFSSDNNARTTKNPLNLSFSFPVKRCVTQLSEAADNIGFHSSCDCRNVTRTRTLSVGDIFSVQAAESVHNERLCSVTVLHLKFSRTSWGGCVSILQ